MNHYPKRIGVLDLIFFSLVFCPISSRALMTFQPNDGNVRYLNDLRRSTGILSGMTSITTGDYDGNGLNDVAVCMNPYAGHRTIDLFLAPFNADSAFSMKKTVEIRYSISGDIRNRFVPPSMAMADLNGDGMADLIVGRLDSSSGSAEVDILMGNKNPSGVIDLDEQSPDCRIIGVSHVAVGDFNGDGISDLALTKAGSALGYIGLGGVGQFSGVINLSVADPFHRISLNGNLRYILTGDFNGDKKTDFAFSPPEDGLDGFWREVNIVFGRGSLPSPPSPGGLAVDVRILGNSDCYFAGMAAGDTTGDGQAELFLQQIQGSQGGTLWALDGADISGGNSLLLQSTGQPNSVAFHSVGIGALSAPAPMVAADFDGDGADDFFPVLQNRRTSGFLTSAVHPGGISLSAIGSPAMEWVGMYESVGAGDLNGDSFKDLVVYEPFFSIYPPYGALRVFFGFRPLTNPSISAMSIETVSPRVSLVLGVDGNPTEMSLSGDITNDFKDKWIPYKAIHEVLLSPKEETKTVAVIFRNAVGRTSHPAQTTVDFEAKGNIVVTETNRLRPGGEVSFDCHVMTSGSLRARIFNSAGMEIRDLENRMVEPGIYSLFWNGQNAFGNRVGRGVYYLAIEANGERTQKEILVE